MALSLVQKKTGANAVSNVAISVAFSSNVTSGNLLFAIWGQGGLGGSGGTTLTDTMGNTWTLTVNQSSIDGNMQLQVYWAIANASGPNTVTMTLGVAGFQQLIVAEYSGFTSPTTDQSNGTFAFTPPFTIGTGSVTTTQTGDLLIAAAVSSADAGLTWSATGGFTIQATANSAGGSSSLVYADQLGVPIAAYSSTFSSPGIINSTELEAGILAIKGTAATNPTKLEISLFGIKRFGKNAEAECVEAPAKPSPPKRVM